MVPLEVRACLGLWAAVMQVAVEDFLGRGPMPSRKDGSRDELRASAADWLASPDEGARTFLWICTLLDLDPSAVRATLARRTEAPPP